MMEKPEEYERIFLITLATLYIVYLFFIYFLRQTYIRIQRFGRRWLPWPKLSIPVSIVLTLFIMLYFKQDHSNRGHHHHHHYDENNPLWQYKYREFLDFVFDHTLGGSPITPRHTDDHIVYLYYGTLILLLIISFYIYSIRFFLDHHIYGFFMFIVALSLVYFPIHEISEKYSSIQYIDESNQIQVKPHIIIKILATMILVYHIVTRLFNTFTFFLRMIVQFFLFSSMIIIVLAIIGHLYENIQEMNESKI